MGQQLIVAGIDVTAYVVQDGWSIAQNWSRQGDTASFTLTDEHPVRTKLSFTVPPLSTVVFRDTTLGQTLFSGVVPKPQVKFDSPTLATWQLDCVDWTFLSDRQLVVGDFSGYTADGLVVLLAQLFPCGITCATPANGGYVYPGPQIPRIQFSYDTLTTAWTKISKLVSLDTTYGWYIDENRALHFTTLAQAVDSGWTMTDDITAQGQPNTQMYDNDTFAYEWDATSIRNSIIVRGASYSQQQTDLFVGNGSQISFPLTFVPDANNISNATLTVGGVAKTVSAQTGASATTQWVIVRSANNQWFLVANTDAAPAGATILSLTYPYLQPVVSRVSDQASIAAFSTLPNGGVFGYNIPDQTIPTLLAAQTRGQREIATYSTPTERVQLDATKDFTGHFRAGQLITVHNAMVPDSRNGYTPGLTGSFIVLQNRINGEKGAYRSYQMTGARL